MVYVFAPPGTIVKEEPVHTEPLLLVITGRECTVTCATAKVVVGQPAVLVPETE
jgi:hypothetical protein